MAPESLAHDENAVGRLDCPILIDCSTESIEVLMEVTSDLGLDLPLECEDVGVCSEGAEGAEVGLRHHPEPFLVKICLAPAPHLPLSFL